MTVPVFVPKYALHLVRSPDASVIQYWSSSPFGAYEPGQDFVLGAMQFQISKVSHRVVCNARDGLLIFVRLDLASVANSKTKSNIDELWAEEGGTGPVVPWPW